MSRIPIRLRVAAAFTVAMALVLTATGAFVYASVGSDLNESINQDLRVRAQDVGTLVSQPGGRLAAVGSGLVERGETFAELLAPDGRVLDATPTLARHALLMPAAVAAVRRATFIDRRSAPGLDEPARLLATPVRRAGRPAVLVVGATRENRAEALRSLRTKLLVAGPVALVLATILGYLLAGTGLRAVETMRRRAAGISGDRPGDRIPVPPARDELRRLGETLNEMLDRLERALERERGFVADASHELRTPLSLLRAELDFALEHARGEAELREALQHASAETDRLVQLAAALLLLAGSDRGAVELRREPVAAADLLESLRSRFALRAAGEGRPLEGSAPEGLTLGVDRVRVEQALGSLVDNALRHGAGAIRIDLTERDGRVELRVSDEGPGFRDDFLAHAFERFSRPDGSRAGDGAGLGLAIVEAVARAHSGHVRAANRAGGGAEVAIELVESGTS